MHNHTIQENSVLMHARNKGVIENIDCSKYTNDEIFDIIVDVVK